jgi:hypothetical protein
MATRDGVEELWTTRRLKLHRPGREVGGNWEGERVEIGSRLRRQEGWFSVPIDKRGACRVCDGHGLGESRSREGKRVV